MIRLITKGVDDVRKAVLNDAKQLRFGVQRGMNETTTAAKKAVDKAMPFKNPTPYIKQSLKGVYVPKAWIKTKEKTATGGVAVKHPGFSKAGQGSAPSSTISGGSEKTDAIIDILMPHITGGARKPKASERMLRRAGLIESNEFLVPSRTAPLDKYGNIKKGVIQKILTDLSAHTSAGYTANINTGQATRRGRTRKAQYIIGETSTVKGIFQVAGGAGRLATGRRRLIFLIVKGAPRYRKTFKFNETVTKVFNRKYDRAVNKWFDIGLRTAK